MKTLTILAAYVSISANLLVLMIIAIVALVIFIVLQARYNKKEREKLNEWIKVLEREKRTDMLQSSGVIQEKDKEIKRLIEENKRLLRLKAEEELLSEP